MIVSRKHHQRRQKRPLCRRGAAALDHVLVLAVTLPILTIVIPVGERMIRAVWEMTCMQISWPFM